MNAEGLRRDAEFHSRKPELHMTPAVRPADDFLSIDQYASDLPAGAYHHVEDNELVNACVTSRHLHVIRSGRQAIMLFGGLKDRSVNQLKSGARF